MPQPSPDQPAWCVVFTLSRHEKKIHSCFAKKQITSYLPIYRQVRQWRDRKKKVDMPMFPNYVFVKIPLNDRFKVFEVPGVIKFLNSNAAPTIVSPVDIELIKCLSKADIEVTNEGFEKGDWVVVTSGTFKGLRGILINKKGSKRILVEISGIQRHVSLEISPFHVQKIEKDS